MREYFNIKGKNYYMNISIIIPVLGTPENYLTECLRSLRNPFIPDAEIIIIDGAPNEKNKALAERFFAEYVEYPQKSILSTRCEGIKRAHGTHIAFVDSDDFVSPYYHATLLKKAAKSTADVVIGDWCNYDSPKTVYTVLDGINNADVCFNSRNALKNAFYLQGARSHSMHVLWNKLYKREVLIRATERLVYSELRFAEDVLINSAVTDCAESAVSAHGGYYFYRRHPLQTVGAGGKTLLNSAQAASDVFRALIVRDGANFLGDIYNWAAVTKQSQIALAETPELKAEILSVYEKGGFDERNAPVYKEFLASSVKKALPLNFKEIENVIEKIYFLSSVASVKRSAGQFFKNGLAALGLSENVEYVHRNYNFEVPKERFAIKNRLYCNTAVSRLINSVFPKGKRSRNIIKNIFLSK